MPPTGGTPLNRPEARAACGMPATSSTPTSAGSSGTGSPWWRLSTDTLDGSLYSEPLGSGGEGPRCLLALAELAGGDDQIGLVNADRSSWQTARK
jgi:hypothetical protein